MSPLPAALKPPGTSFATRPKTSPPPRLNLAASRHSSSLPTRISRALPMPRSRGSSPRQGRAALPDRASSSNAASRTNSSPCCVRRRRQSGSVLRSIWRPKSARLPPSASRTISAPSSPSRLKAAPASSREGARSTATATISHRRFSTATMSPRPRSSRNSSGRSCPSCHSRRRPRRCDSPTIPVMAWLPASSPRT